MSHHDEGNVVLPAYAARASVLHKLVLEDLNEATRSNIVYSGTGPRAVPIHFRADGIVIFEFDTVDEYAGGVVDPYEVPDTGHIPSLARRASEARDLIRERRYRYMNSFLTCFNVALNRTNDLIVPCSSAHYIWARKEQGRWHLMDNGSGRLAGIPIFPDAVPVETLSAALSNFNQVRTSQIEEALQTLDLFYRVAFHMNNHEFQTVIILCWAIVEGSQGIIWEEFVRSGYKSINPHSDIKGARLKNLLSDRNYTASIKSQMLALSGVYSDQDIELIDKVRRKRNSFLHGLDLMSSGDAFSAMWACQRIVEKAFNLKIAPFGNPTSWDYKR
jgi:hypothetical protein